MIVAKRLQHIQSSPAMVLDATAKAMKKEGIAVINLSAGEPDFETPESIKKATIQAINDGMTRYTKAQGIDDLRTVISQRFEKENNLSYKPSQIIVGAGSKQIFYSAFQVLCQEGDEVIIPVPTWTSFVEQVKLTGATPVLLKLVPPFKLTAKDVESVLTPKSKVLILNSPSNPTGMIIENEELEKIADLVVKNNLWVISDEIYEQLVYGVSHTSIASLNPEIKERTLTVNGVSKTYAMTGWRVGYAGGPEELIKYMVLHQSQILTNVSSISQMAALAALSGEQDSTKKMLNEYTKRREYLLQEFAKLDQFSLNAPEGAFYLFVSVEKLLGGKYPTAVEWCKGLLEQEHVVVVPGEAFMYPEYFRMSFAASIEDLEEAIKRIKRFIT